MTSVVPSIYVVDDDAAFRVALARLLRACGYHVTLYDSGDQLLENPPADQSGCILLDLDMPGLNGLQLQKRLAQSGILTPVIFLTGRGDIPTTVQAMKGGAEDFLSKPVTKDALLVAIKHALARGEGVRAHDQRLGALRDRVNALTQREAEVFALVVRGRLNKQIAGELGVAERTVKAHRHSIVEKLQVRSSAELASIAERLGILTWHPGG
jgi:FixJ family two-component response regulator